MKRQHGLRYILKSYPLLVIIAAVFTFANVAKAERPTANNIYAWLVNMGGIAFDASGGMYLPQNVLTGLRDGRFSDFSQLLLLTHQMAACVEKTIEKAPGRTTPYVTARDLFEDGLCRLTSCFQQSLTVAILTETNRQLKAASGLTNQQKNEARQQIALAMYGSFKNKKCKGGGQGFDTLMFTTLGGLTAN